MLAAANGAGDAGACAALKAAMEAQGKRGAALGKDDFTAAEAHDTALGEALEALRTAELAPKPAHPAGWCAAELDTARAKWQARRYVALKRAMDAHGLKEAAMEADDFTTAAKHAAEYNIAASTIPVHLIEALTESSVLLL